MARIISNFAALGVALALANCATEKPLPTPHADQAISQETRPGAAVKADEKKKANKRDLEEASKKLHNLQERLSPKE